MSTLGLTRGTILSKTGKKQVASALLPCMIWNEVGLPAWSHIQRLKPGSNGALNWKPPSLAGLGLSVCLDFSSIAAWLPSLKCLTLCRTGTQCELHFAWPWPLGSLVLILVSWTLGFELTPTLLPTAAAANLLGLDFTYWFGPADTGHA